MINKSFFFGLIFFSGFTFCFSITV